MIHELKTWPEYFARIQSGEKTFEVRKNDRDFQTGDTLLLKEYEPDTESYTGKSEVKMVSYTPHGGSFGIEPGYVVMGLGNPDN